MLVERRYHFKLNFSLILWISSVYLWFLQICSYTAISLFQVFQGRSPLKTFRKENANLCTTDLKQILAGKKLFMVCLYFQYVYAFKLRLSNKLILEDRGKKIDQYLLKCASADNTKNWHKIQFEKHWSIFSEGQIVPCCVNGNFE